MANELQAKVKPFAKASNARAIFQMINTVLPFALLIVAMYVLIINNVSYVYVLGLSVIAALFLVRIFIMFHDCTHNSFMTSRKVMIVLGHLFGILTFTPFFKWQRDHITHHRTAGNLDKRGIGDVWMMTTQEYEDASMVKRFKYRMYRNPFILFFIAPVLLFLVSQRIPTANTKKVWLSTMITNVGIIAIILAVTFTVGFQYYLLIQLPIIFFAAIFGVWLFYIQHQYEDVYWARTMKWKSQHAALEGASVYKLPFILEWFTGAIGYHNVHHLNPRVPNYHLRKTYHAVPDLQEGYIVTFLRSFKLSFLCFYDEKKQIMISYRQYKNLQKA